MATEGMNPRRRHQGGEPCEGSPEEQADRAVARAWVPGPGVRSQALSHCTRFYTLALKTVGALHRSPTVGSEAVGQGRPELMTHRSTRWMLAATLVHAACGGNPFISSSGPSASVARIEIVVPSEHLVAGQTVQARARLLEASGKPLTGRSVTWSSRNDSVATVDRNGVIAGISAGNATITAASEDRTGLVAMTVVPVPVGAVVVALSSGTIQVGQTSEATAVVRDASGNALAGRSVIWASSDRSVATVDRDGVVAGVSAGSVDVTGTSEGQSGSAVLTVWPVPIAVVEVALSSGAAFIGQTVLATATARDAAGKVVSDRAVTWSSSDPSVATVDGNGLVTAVASGTALIDAICEGVSGSAALSATSAPVAVVEVALLSGSIAIGEATQAPATLRDAGGNVLSGQSVSWASSNAMVATVDGSGLVNAREVGSAFITATGEGRSGSATLTVTPIPVARIDVAIASGSLFVGQTTRASATLRDASGNVLTGRVVTWSSSNTRWRPSMALASSPRAARGRRPSAPQARGKAGRRA